MDRPSPRSLAAVAARGAEMLVEAGVAPDEARRDATLLARWLLRWDGAAWLAHSRDLEPAGFADPYFALMARRAAREPLAYLTGVREFYGRVFRVTRAVLIPRPETELVVEEALRCLADRALDARRRAPLVVDVGTGSGCLAITLALECPAAQVVATDVSTDALDLARANARRLGAADRIAFREGPWLAGMEGPVDLVVSNPPYVAEADRDSLPREVVDFEPSLALFGGRDGLDATRGLCAHVTAALAASGRLVLEIGHGQFDSVRQVIEKIGGLQVERVASDLQGIPRVVIARRPDTIDSLKLRSSNS